MAKAKINSSGSDKVLPSQTPFFHAAAEGKQEEHTWTSGTGPLSEH